MKTCHSLSNQRLSIKRNFSDLKDYVVLREKMFTLAIVYQTWNTEVPVLFIRKKTGFKKHGRNDASFAMLSTKLMVPKFGLLINLGSTDAISGICSFEESFSHIRHGWLNPTWKKRFSLSKMNRGWNFLSANYKISISCHSALKSKFVPDTDLDFSK